MYIKMNEKEARLYVESRARYELGNSWDCIELFNEATCVPLVYVSAFGSNYRECVLWEEGTEAASEIFDETFEDIYEMAKDYMACNEGVSLVEAFNESYDEYWFHADYWDIFSSKLGEDEWVHVIMELASDYIMSHFDDEIGELEIPDEWEEYPQWKEQKITF